MPVFPRTFITGDTAPSFHPLFRLLDDFDSYSQRDDGSPGHNSLARTFNPKFDVRELENGYELHGELPGIEQKDVEIEFTDSQTLNIRGKIEREYTSGEKPEDKPEEETKKIESHQPTVEDADDNAEAAPTTSVEKANEKQVQHHHVKKHTPKFWVSERSIGSFSRVFNFAQPLDHDNVKASMKNGLLTIFVPKKKAESRRIQIQ
jgi:HSP20 family molecular chaperone IbpA